MILRNTYLEESSSQSCRARDFSISLATEKNSRQSNQDAYLCSIDPQRDFQLLMLADGLGGHKNGALASYDTLSFLSDMLKDEELTVSNSKLKLTRAIRDASNHILASPDNRDTTLVVAVLFNQQVIIANIGDSWALMRQPASDGDSYIKTSIEGNGEGTVWHTVRTLYPDDIAFYNWPLPEVFTLVLATDGIDHLGRKRIFEIAREENGAAKLCQHSQKAPVYMPDNATVILVDRMKEE